MGTLRSLGALARAVGPMAAASGEGCGTACRHAIGLGRQATAPGGDLPWLPPWVRVQLRAAIPGLGGGGRGQGGLMSPPAVSPQCTGWWVPQLASPCAQGSSCSPSSYCGPCHLRHAHSRLSSQASPTQAGQLRQEVGVWARTTPDGDCWPDPFLPSGAQPSMSQGLQPQGLLQHPRPAQPHLLHTVRNSKTLQASSLLAFLHFGTGYQPGV